MKHTLRHKLIALIGVLLLTEVPIKPVAAAKAAPVASKPHTPEWRSFRTVWSVKLDSWGMNYVSDMLLRDDRVLCACDASIGCLDKATGKLLWRFPFTTEYGPIKEQNGGYSPQDGWKLTANAQYVYAVNGKYRQIHAVDIATGAQAWEHTLASSALEAPTLAGETLIVPTADGSMEALNCKTGKPLWTAHLTPERERYALQYSDTVLHGNATMVIAQAKGSRLVAYSLRTGARLWEYLPYGSTDRRTPFEFAIKDGICYAAAGFGASVAIDVSTGRCVWSKKADTTGARTLNVALLDGMVLSRHSQSGSAQNGVVSGTVWGKVKNEDSSPHLLGPLALPWLRDKSSTINGLGIFNVRYELARINGVQRRFRSLDCAGAKTLFMLDTVSGRELWRWQPDDGISIDKLQSDGNRFYLSDNSSIQAVMEGEPDPIPSDIKVRRDVASWMLRELMGPEDGEQQPLAPPVFVKGRAGRDAATSGEATLTLLRLGYSSVGPLLDFARRHIAASDMYMPSIGSVPDPDSLTVRSYGFESQAAEALQIVADIGDPACVPTLVDLLERTKDPGSRQSVAETLIKLGDPRAAPALFQYAQSETDSTYTRQDALYWICRMPEAALPQKPVTDYLLTCLNNSKSPWWLRVFARFELLNSRGDVAQKTALNSFVGEPTAQILPRDITLQESEKVHVVRSLSDLVPKGFPTEVHILSEAPLSDNERWGAFLSDYLGDEDDLWFARSSDGVNWTNPVFGINLTSGMAPGGLAGKIKIRHSEGALIVSWEETAFFLPHRTVAHSDQISVADLTWDSDDDGLTDRLEEEIGSDPHNRSTRNDGISDAESKNPGFHPHQLTDDEGIYQAAVEALCQTGRAQLEAKLDWPVPLRYGGSYTPLILHLPPGSSGIKITGHPGPVIFRKLLRTQNGIGGNWFSTAIPNCRFVAPHIDLQGVLHQSFGGLAEWLQDAFTEPQSEEEERAYMSAYTTRMTWRQYFPYVLSADGTTARVGWEENEAGGSHQWTVGYDIEVRKIEGQWLPTECRKVTVAGGVLSMIQGIHDDSVVVVPDAPMHSR